MAIGMPHRTLVRIPMVPNRTLRGGRCQTIDTRRALMYRYGRSTRCCWFILTAAGYGGHGSRNTTKEWGVCNKTHPPNELALKMDGAEASDLAPSVRTTTASTKCCCAMGWHGGSVRKKHACVPRLRVLTVEPTHGPSFH